MTRNLVIYHCLCCGAVMHCEPDDEVPQCCGRPMIKAAAETVVNGEPGAADSGPGARVPCSPDSSDRSDLQRKPR